MSLLPETTHPLKGNFKSEAYSYAVPPYHSKSLTTTWSLWQKGVYQSFFKMEWGRKLRTVPRILHQTRNCIRVYFSPPHIGYIEFLYDKMS